MRKSDLENRIKELELELRNIKSGKIAESLQREILFRQAIEKSIPSGIVVVDDTGKQVYVNQSFCNLFGWDESELLEKYPPFIYWSQYDLGNINNAFQQTLNDKAPKEGFDLIFCHKTGRLIPVNAIISQFPQENNKLFFLANVIDITERKQTEIDLKERERDLRNLAESMPQIVWTTDADGLNNYFNQQWVDYTGITLEESYGHGWNSPFHPDDQKRAWEAWQNAVNNNAEYSIESRLRCHDGTYHWWLVRGVPQMDENGKILKWFGTCTDIEKIKFKENELRESEERYRLLFENMNSGFQLNEVIVDENNIPVDFRYLDGNSQMKLYTGFSIEEVRGKTIKQLIPDADINMIRSYGNVALTGEEMKYEYFSLTFNKYFKINAYCPHKGLFAVIFDDITKRKLEEEEILKMREALDTLRTRYEEISENERKLFSNEIHDQLGQTLTALKFDIHWLKGKFQSDSKESTKIQGIIELLSSTIKDVQRISTELHPAMLDELGLSNTIEWYCKEFEKRTGIKCQLKLDEIKSFDEKKGLALYRVLQEALTNVGRHSNAKNVNINLYQADDSIILDVTDDGIGIEKEKIKSYKSLGFIGMQERAKKYNGTLDVSSALKKGTKIRVSIPLN